MVMPSVAKYHVTLSRFDFGILALFVGLVFPCFIWIYLYLVVYLTIEISFLIANLEKFPHGGYITLLVGGGLFSVMYIWFRSRKIKNRYVEFVRLQH
jgi:KUP system potassium uptake protein